VRRLDHRRVIATLRRVSQPSSESIPGTATGPRSQDRAGDIGVVYLVFSHRNPAQVVRLVRRLRGGSDRSHIVLHHDQTSTRLDRSLFAGLTNVHLLPYRAIEWGTFTWVDAILRAIRWTLEHLDFDWLLLLSGQDYPIQPLSQIERFLETTDYDAFVKGFPLGSRPQTAGEDVRRYFYRYYRVAGGSRFSRSLASRGRGATMARRVQRAQPLLSFKRGPSGLYVGIRRLTLPFNQDFRWYRGSAWFTLSRKAVAVVDRFAARATRRMRYFRRMWVPDESFVATVILNEPGMRVHHDHLRFIRFGAGPHPDILTIKDAEEILSSGKHFARKFDISVDERILDLIDERRHGSSSSP
jgi:hypothetical protein